MSPTLDPIEDDPATASGGTPLPLPHELLAAGALAAAAAAFAREAPPATPTPKPAESEPDDALCVTCGLSLPAWETECAFCAHARAAQSNSMPQLLRHWLVFILTMLAIFGAGWMIAP